MLPGDERKYKFKNIFWNSSFGISKQEIVVSDDILENGRFRKSTFSASPNIFLIYSVIHSNNKTFF